VSARLFPRGFYLLVPLSILISATLFSAASGTQVTPVGAMREVMWGSRMEAVLDLDTLADRRHLYGLGPLDSLRGELLVVDGKVFRSTVRYSPTMTASCMPTCSPWTGRRWATCP